MIVCSSSRSGFEVSESFKVGGIITNAGSVSLNDRLPASRLLSFRSIYRGLFGPVVVPAFVAGGFAAPVAVLGALLPD